MSKNSGVILCLQFERREELIREVRGERRGTAEGRSSAPAWSNYPPRCWKEMSVMESNKGA